MTAPLFSFVIPVYNDPTSIAVTLAAIQKRAHSYDFEVIVVDDCSSIPIESDPSINILVRNDDRLGISASRARGTEYASGKILVHLDAHCVLSEDALPALLAEIQRSPHVIYGVPLSFTANRTEFARAADLSGEDWTQHNFGWKVITEPVLSTSPLPPRVLSDAASSPVPIVPSAALALTRNLYDRVGGFDPGLPGGGRAEDTELCLAAWALGFQVRQMRVGRCLHYAENHSSPIAREKYEQIASHISLLHFDRAVKETSLAPVVFQRLDYLEARRLRSRSEVEGIASGEIIASGTDRICTALEHIGAPLEIVDSGAIKISSSDTVYLCLTEESHDVLRRSGIRSDRLLAPPLKPSTRRDFVWRRYSDSWQQRAYPAEHPQTSSPETLALLRDRILQYSAPIWYLEDKLSEVVNDLAPQCYGEQITNPMRRSVVERLMNRLGVPLR